MFRFKNVENAIYQDMQILKNENELLLRENEYLIKKNTQLTSNYEHMYNLTNGVYDENVNLKNIIDMLKNNNDKYIIEINEKQLLIKNMANFLNIKSHEGAIYTQYELEYEQQLDEDFKYYTTLGISDKLSDNMDNDTNNIDLDIVEYFNSENMEDIEENTKGIENTEDIQTIQIIKDILGINAHSDNIEYDGENINPNILEE
jgi:hypothetical protein